jgi:integrase
MGRPKGSTKIPGYCLHKPSGRAYVTLSGRPHQLGQWGTRQTSPESWAKYDRLIAEWLATGRATIQSHTADLTITELVAGYVKWVELNLPDTSIVKHARTALRAIVRLYGPTLAADFGPLKLKAVREDLINSTRNWKYGGKEKKLARSTVNGNITEIRRLIRWAVSNEMIPVSVGHAISTVRSLVKGRTTAREQSPVGPVDDAVVEATIPFLCPPLRAIARLQLITGMRSGEAARMRSCDIDTRGDVWHYRPHQHKTKYRGHDRVIRLGPKAQEIIRPWLRTDVTEYLFKPHEGGRLAAEERVASRIEAARKIINDKSLNTVFKRSHAWCAATGEAPWQFARYRWYAINGYRPGEIPWDKKDPRKRNGRKKKLPCYTSCTYGGAVAGACLAADKAAHEADPSIPADKVIVPHWHPHQIRHTVAVRLREKFGVEAASIVLGHRSIDVTQLYAESNLMKAERVMADVG